MNATQHAEDPAWLAHARRIAGLSPERFRRRVEKARPEDRAALLRARFRFRRLEFARYVLPEVVYLPWNTYQREALDGAPAHWLDRRAVGETYREAHAAPRGIAKSTTTKIDLLHRLCYGLEGFVVVLSATVRDAGLWSRSIRRWCEEPPPRLAALYGPIHTSGATEQFRVQVGGHPGVTVLSLSYGTAIRGINDATVRPTYVIIDDGEDRKKVLNATIREEWQTFLTADVLKLGFREGGTEYRWRGTVLHPDAVLARLLAGAPPNAGWAAKRYQAVVEWPEREDLWTECGRIYQDLTLGDVRTREAAARAYYDERREEMDRGAVVLDPHALPIFRCYLTIWSEGIAAFSRELQNDPRNPELAIFDSSTFQRFRLVGRGASAVIERTDARGRVVRVPLAECTAILRWDPAAGGVGGDYAAIVAMARDRHGYSYVLAVWMRQEKPTAQIAAAFTLAETLGISLCSYENNGFQRTLEDSFNRERDRRRLAGEFWQLQLVGEPSTTNKEDRICALEVPISAGWLLFADDLPRPYMAQWDAITAAGSMDHDDGPDATEGAYVRLGVRTANVQGARAF